MFFCSVLLAGVPQYGLVVHPQKVVVNFQPGSTDSFPHIRMLPPHCLFPWCGLLLDTHSLDIHKDYSRWIIRLPLGCKWRRRVQPSSPWREVIGLPLLFLVDRANPITPHDRTLYALVNALRDYATALSVIKLDIFLIFSKPSSFAGLSVRYSLSLGSFHCAGQQMRRKLMSILKLKCHAVFVDLKVRKKHFVEAFSSKNILSGIKPGVMRLHTSQLSLAWDKKWLSSFFLRFHVKTMHEVRSTGSLLKIYIKKIKHLKGLILCKPLFAKVLPVSELTSKEKESHLYLDSLQKTQTFTNQPFVMSQRGIDNLSRTPPRLVPTPLATLPFSFSDSHL